MKPFLRFVLPVWLVLLVFAGAQTTEIPPEVTRVPVVFSGGHDTDRRDGGRPVVLIAAALEVKPEVFREAFRHVHPANPEVGPTREEANRNKAALLGVLGPLGVTNDRLDTVSNYYRYVPEHHELWKHEPAVANALVRNGAIIGFEIVRGGAGYSSAPTVSVPQVAVTNAIVELEFGKDLETNGRVRAITLPAVSAKSETGTP
jgi:hypothetical protein